ncbi:MAG: cell division protein, partial [Leifsonia sp.]
LHEEHVREGMEKRDALIAEGHATAARVVSEAQQAQQAQMAGLEQEKQNLERKVEELRSFEKEYREKLRSYIESQLRDLQATNVVTGGGAPQEAAAAPQLQPAQAAAPAGYDGPQAPDYGAYPQPTDYPGFAAGN